MIELISEFQGQLNAQVPRLKLLREKKIEDPGNALPTLQISYPI